MKKQNFPIRQKLQFRVFIIMLIYTLSGLIAMPLLEYIFPDLRIRFLVGCTCGWMSFIFSTLWLVLPVFFIITGENRGTIWMRWSLLRRQYMSRTARQLNCQNRSGSGAADEPD